MSQELPPHDKQSTGVMKLLRRSAKAGVGKAVEEFVKYFIILGVITLATVLGINIFTPNTESGGTNPIGGSTQIPAICLPIDGFAYQQLDMYIGGALYDYTFATGHYAYMLDSSTIQIGTVAYGLEENEFISNLPLGEWVNVHPFSTLDGAYAFCVDQYGLHAAVVDYDF